MTSLASPFGGGSEGGTQSTFARVSMVRLNGVVLFVLGSCLFDFVGSDSALALVALPLPPRTSDTCSHSDNHGIPSNLTAVSRAMTSASVELWDTADCFLHSHVIGTNVCVQTKHSTEPVLDLESFRYPAKLASA